MDKLFNISIVTSDKVIYEGKASSLIAPTESGYLGILANHTPLAAKLASGKISLEEPSKQIKDFNFKGKGILEVNKNSVSLLLEPK